MSLWQTIKNWIIQPAQPLYYGHIPDDHVDVGAGGDPAKPGEAYLRLWLSQMQLKNDRTWFQDWYPVAHALVQVRFADQEVTVPYLAGPGFLKDLNQGNLNKVIQLNHQLTGLLPFNGGSVDLQSGLIAMQGGNQLTAALDVISEMSSLLAVPQLSSVLSIADPLASGVQGLLNTASGGLHVGLQQTLTANSGGSNILTPGYFVAIAAPQDKVRPNTLWVVEDRLRTGANSKDSTPFTQASFMLFRLEVTTEHDNYQGFTSIERSIKEAEKLAFNGQVDEAVPYLRAACLDAWQSPDLTKADRTRLVQALKARFAEAKEVGGGLNLKALKVVDDVSMEDRVRKVCSARAAMEAPDMDLAAVLG